MADPATIAAGKLRHEVVVQRPDPASPVSTKGQRQTAYLEVARVRADVQPLMGRDAFIAAQVKASASHTITLRYSARIAAIDGSWRVLKREGKDDAGNFTYRVFILDGLPQFVGERKSIIVLPCIESARQK